MNSAVKLFYTVRTADFLHLFIYAFFLITGHGFVNGTIDESSSAFFHRGCVILDDGSAFRSHADFHFYKFAIVSGIGFLPGLRQFPSGLFLFTHSSILSICPFGRIIPKRL